MDKKDNTILNGRYKIIRPVGYGGMAEVFLAHDELLDRNVAVKMLRDQFLSDKELLEQLNHVLTSDFGHVTYTEAIELLKPHNDQFEYPVHWGSDLQTEHERYLTEVLFKRPLFVTDYPKEIKAFYMKLNPFI